MAIENNIIKSPVHLAANVARLLQTNKMTTAALCTHPNINKWSKSKPINFPKITLEQADFRGCSADISNNILYGMRVGIPGGTWAKLHEANYEYVGKPQGGSYSPYRLGDFLNYYHEAKPDKTGITASIADGVINLQLIRSDTSELSVSLNDLVSGDVESFYPCVMVDNYVHALKNVRTGTYTPLTYNGQQYFNFEIDVPTSSPNWKAAAVRTVSFFLAQRISDGFSYDYSSAWTNTSGQITSNTVIAIPNTVGLSITVRGFASVSLVTSIKQTSSGQYRVTLDGSTGIAMNMGDTMTLSVNISGVEQSHAYDVIVGTISTSNPDLSNPTPIIKATRYLTVKASDFGLSTLVGRTVTYTFKDVETGSTYSVSRMFQLEQ